MDFIDAFLNRFTIYRFTLLSLWILAGVAFVESLFGWLPYTPVALVVSLLVLLFTTRITSALCALFTHTTATPGSASITACILFFILSPLKSAEDALFLIAAGVLAILFKFILSFNKKSIFNAAAFAAFVLSISNNLLVSWWISTSAMLLFVVVLGFLILHKSRQIALFCIFAGTALVVTTLRLFISGTEVYEIVPAILAFIGASPLVFIGVFMLTDPHTMPASYSRRRIFAGIVGLLFSGLLFIAPMSVAAEIAVLVGNAYAFVFGMRSRVGLAFQTSTKLSREIYEFTFLPASPLLFKSGQYIELVLPHASADKHGIRRHFSIVSEPGEYLLRLAIHMPIESSTFKQAMHTLKKGEKLIANGPYGDFVLPSDSNQKLLALAVGVGIAPFMSIFRHLVTRHERRDMVLIYTTNTPLDFAYKDEIDSFKDSIGLRVIYVPTDFTDLFDWKGPSGIVTEAVIKKEIPDFLKRVWYAAGPGSVVRDYARLAQSIKVPRALIKVECF